jgi:hypothetical protein
MVILSLLLLLVLVLFLLLWIYCSNSTSSHNPDLTRKPSIFEHLFYFIFTRKPVNADASDKVSDKMIPKNHRLGFLIKQLR